jgi:methyl-accepting chemotaxis protein
MNLSISRIMTTISAAIVVTIGVQAAISYSSLTYLQGAVGEIANNRVPAFIQLGQMNTDLSDSRIAQSDYLNAAADKRSAFEDGLKSARQAIDDDIRQYEPYLVDQADKDYLATFKQKFAAASADWDEAKKLLDAGKVDEARAKFYGPALKTYEDAGHALQDAVDDMKGDVSSKGSDALSAIGSAMSKTMGALGLLLLLSIGTGMFTFGYIARPMSRVVGTMRKLAEGDIDVQIERGTRRDEIGEIIAALDMFRDAAIDKRRLEAEAEEGRRRAEVERVETQKRAEADAAERLRVATSGLAAGLKRLADGDLAFQINETFAPDFEALRHDFNQSVRQLGSALTDVSHSIRSMDDGTREIADGTSELSKRTEQQAAALEETAAALDEITANVSNSTKRTEDARAVATRANQSALKSAEVVSHAEDAMRKIEASSQQISNIIGVIDEIAFQTNLLALNAGVEAARAGEAGKGFAVVAQEVRELAQRSAQAAKEIKGLIQNSSAEVESGVKLVHETGDALKSIGAFIVEINVHMEAIATSATEQSTGLAEVNNAVNSMDQTTQQNAAMVEEATAASSTLAQEAQKLRNLVGRFQLEGATATQVTALRQTARSMAAPETPKRTVAPVRAKVASGGASSDWEEF